MYNYKKFIKDIYDDRSSPHPTNVNSRDLIKYYGEEEDYDILNVIY